MENLKNFLLFFFYGVAGSMHHPERNALVINANAHLCPEHERFLGWGGITVGLFLGGSMGLLLSIALLFSLGPFVLKNIEGILAIYWLVYWLFCSIPCWIFLSWVRAKNAWQYVKEGYILQ